MAQDEVEIKTFMFRPIGGLDMDSFFNDVATEQGFFINALNVSSVNLFSQGDNYLSPYLGNDFSFAPATIAAQTAVWQLTISEPTTGSGNWATNFLMPNGSSVGGGSPTVGAATGLGNLVADAAAYAAAIEAGVLTIYGNAPTATVVSVVGNVAIITITFAPPTVVGFNFIISDDAGYSGFITSNPILIKEAFSHDVTGKCYEIGSTHLGSDLFVLSTPILVNPSVYNVTGAVSIGFGQIELTIGSNLTGKVANGDSISVSDVGGVPAADGEWIVASISYGGSTTLQLYNSLFAGAYTSGGTITANYQGFLDISVNQKNVVTGVWTSYDLLQTTELNNRFTYPLTDCLCDSKNNTAYLYFTDNHDLPRIFQYSGAYMTNGALNNINSANPYFIGSLSDQMYLFLGNANATISFVSQQEGGGVEIGNWAYAVEYVTSDQTATAPSLLYRDVSVGQTVDGGTVAYGGTAGVKSSYSNTLQINDIQANVFPYLNLIGVNYTGLGEVAYLIKQVPIPPGATSLQVTHTGNETYQNYDAALLDKQNAVYLTVETMDICTNNLVIANLSVAETADWSAFFQTPTHALSKGKNILNPVGDDLYGWSIGEYMQPEANFNSIGYCDNETNRFLGVALLKNGSITPCFYVDDIRFDTNSINVASSLPGQSTRRTGTFSSYDLSSDNPSAGENAYVTYLTFSGFDLTYLINGQQVQDIAERIYIFRVDNNVTGLNEVLGNGLLCRHIQGAAISYDNVTVIQAGADTLDLNCKFDNPFIATSLDFPTLYPNTISRDSISNFFTASSAYNAYSYGAWTGATDPMLYLHSDLVPSLQTGSFYCPDALWGQTAIEYNSIDTVICYGQPDFKYKPSFLSDGVYSNSLGSNSVFLMMAGATFQTSEPSHLAISETVFSPTFGGELPFAGDNYSSSTTETNFGGNTYFWDTIEHYLIQLNGVNFPQNNAQMWNGAGNSDPYQGAYDLGLYYIQYYRDKGSMTAYTTGVSKFGAINQGFGIPTGAFIDIASVDPANISNVSVDVFGGDTFCQQTWFKLRYPTDTTPVSGYGLGVSFFCQNRFNFDMRNTTPGKFCYPVDLAAADWLNTDYTIEESFAYDAGFTPRNIENSSPLYNPELPYITNMYNRIAFSLPDPQDEVINNKRIFPVAQIKDLKAVDGHIFGIRNIGDDLYSWQPYSFNKLYFNDTTTLDTQETDVVIGNATPMSQNPKELSRIGSSNIFGIVRGQDLAGRQCVAWIDIIKKDVMYFDGSEARSLLYNEKTKQGSKMRTWFANNLQFITADNPNLRNGINGVFDPKRKEFIWSVYNFNSGLQNWNSGNGYNAGDPPVYYGTGFEGLPNVYVCIQDTQPNQNLPDSSPLYWQLIPQNYTIVYNLINGEFTTFLTPCPYAYLPWQGTYLTAYSKSPLLVSGAYNGIHEDSLGDPMTWYEYNSTSQQENGFVQWVVNAEKGVSKMYGGMFCNSLIVPYYLNFQTENFVSFLQASDFTSQFNGFLSAIKNDSTNTGINTGNTSRLFGEYLTSQFIFEAGVSQKFYGAWQKYYALNREPFV